MALVAGGGVPPKRNPVKPPGGATTTYNPYNPLAPSKAPFSEGQGVPPRGATSAPAPRSGDDARTSTAAKPRPRSGDDTRKPTEPGVGNAAGKAKAVMGRRRYNATLHPQSRPVLNNSGTNGAGPRAYATGEIIALFEQNNLGGLQNEQRKTNWYNRKTNWAFRFLYNPASFQVSTQVNDKATPTLIDPALFFGQQQAISFELFLNRTAEMNQGIQNLDAKEIIAAGTQYDVNYLYKVINGDAGDVGFLVNTLVRVVFGPSIFFEGFITNIDVQHIQFNARMTPMLSKMTVTMTRVTSNRNPAGEQESAVAP